MKRRKIADRFLLALVGIMIVGTAGSIRVHANNSADKSYRLSYYGDGGDVRTGYYAKTDDTSVYIKHMGDVGAWVSIRVKGSEKNFTWSGNYVDVPLGRGYKMANNVWETYGRRVDVYLRLSPTTHSPCTIHGLWSADSV